MDNSGKTKALEEVLKNFRNADKAELRRKVAVALGLIESDPLVAQVLKVVDRELTLSEQERLEIMDRSYFLRKSC
jgi:hypothetical protein